MRLASAIRPKFSRARAYWRSQGHHLRWGGGAKKSKNKCYDKAFLVLGEKKHAQPIWNWDTDFGRNQGSVAILRVSAAARRRSGSSAAAAAWHGRRWAGCHTQVGRASRWPGQRRLLPSTPSSKVTGLSRVSHRCTPAAEHACIAALQALPYPSPR